MAKSKVLTEVNEGENHKMLRLTLRDFAKSLNYTIKVKFPTGSDPDVAYRSVDMNIFVGDAKHSPNETTSNAQTCERIDRYLKILASALKSQKFLIGAFAIATDNEEEADNWLYWLNDACTQYNYYLPTFEVKEISEGVFLVIDECLTIED